jgi:hypothetical protein
MTRKKYLFPDTFSISTFSLQLVEQVVGTKANFFKNHIQIYVLMC